MVTCIRVPNWRIWAARRLLELPPEPELVLHSGSRVTAYSAGLAAMGVRPGVALGRAQALAQAFATDSGGCLLAEDPGARLELVWEEAVERVYELTPHLEAPSPGLMWARLEGDEAAGLTAELNARLGTAADRSTALLATLAGTGFRQVPRGEEEALADSLPTLNLCDQVDGDTIQRLIWLGFPRVGSLRRLTRPQLEGRFPCGGQLFWLSRPDPSGNAVELYRPSPTLRVSRHTEEPWTELGPLLEVLREAILELRDNAEGRKASFLTLSLESCGAPAWRERRILKEPSAILGRWWTPLKSILEKRLGSLGSCEIERMVVEAGGLVSGHTRQLSLFRSKDAIRAPLQTLDQRFPGRVMQLDWQTGVGLLPEESWTLRPADGRASPVNARASPVNGKARP